MSTGELAEPDGTQEMLAVVEPRRKRESGIAGEQVAKKGKTGTAQQLCLHEIAEEHRLATSDSDEDGTQQELDSAWWQEVECQIEDDLQSDRDWWKVIEDAIREDEVVVIPSTGAAVDKATGKRELELELGHAKRIKRPG